MNCEIVLITEKVDSIERVVNTVFFRLFFPTPLKNKNNLSPPSSASAAWRGCGQPPGGGSDRPAPASRQTPPLQPPASPSSAWVQAVLSFQLWLWEKRIGIRNGLHLRTEGTV